MGTTLQAVETEFAEMTVPGIEGVMEDRAGADLLGALVALVGLAIGGADAGVGPHVDRRREGVNGPQVAQ